MGGIVCIGRQGQDPNQDGSFLNLMAGRLGVSTAIVASALVAVAVLFIILIVVAVRGHSRRRHLERDIAAREEMLLSLMQSVLDNRGPLSIEQRREAAQAGVDPDPLGPNPMRPAHGVSGG